MLYITLRRPNLRSCKAAYAAVTAPSIHIGPFHPLEFGLAADQGTSEDVNAVIDHY